MKSVLELLQMEHKHLDHALCHPRRQSSFDNSAIQKKIQEVRLHKQQLRVQSERKRSQFMHRQQRFEDFPLQQILQESLQPMQQNISLLIKHKIKFIEDKVYIGTKNSVNNQYINWIIDENSAKPALKNQLNLFMEELQANIEEEIVDGEYEIFNKKDLITHKKQEISGANPSKLIQIKKVELSHKIQELRQELNKTQLQQNQLISPSISLKKKSFSMKASSVNESQVTQSLNLQDFSIKSQKTKQAEQFIKKLQQEESKKRRQRKKRQIQLQQLKLKQQKQNKQFQQQIKNDKHIQLKQKFQKEQQQKQNQIQKSNKSKAEYEKFISEYRKRMPLFKQKQTEFNKKLEKEQKQRASSVLAQIKQSKRSIDLHQLKTHEQKYKIVKKQSQEQKLANLKHRKKQIELRHKQDKSYFRGCYHSMIKQQQEFVAEDPLAVLSQRLKKQRQFAAKVKKQHIPQISPQKHRQLQQLITKINRNKPIKQTKNNQQLGNKYLSDLHTLLKQIKHKNQIKINLPSELKPKYKNYLSELKKQRQYQTISYDKKDTEWIQKETIKVEQNIQRKQKILAFTENIDIDQQMKRINQLDMQLLKSAQLKAKLLNKFNHKTTQTPDQSSMDYSQSYQLSVKQINKF